MDEPGMKEQAERFAAHRTDAKAVFASRLVVDAAEIKRLDKHTQEFLQQLKVDAATHEVAVIKKHAQAFEKELHDELDSLFKATRQDLELYKRLLRSLAEYKRELRQIVGDKDAPTLVSSELNYADLLVQSAHEKVETLSLLFKKLKN